MEDATSIKFLPEEILSHLRRLAAEDGRSGDQEYEDALTEVWQQKANHFLSRTRETGLLLVDSVQAGDDRGLLVLSYSGSLLSLGPADPENGARWLEYSSIRLRTDVPDMIVEKSAILEGGLRTGQAVRIQQARIHATSPAYLIAVCPQDLDRERQEEMVREAGIYITTGFMKYNRSLHLDRDNVPDQFTMKSMTRYLAKRHGMTGQEAKLLIEDFLTLVETGMLMGESVPLGRIGRFSVKTRPAQKARIVRHPATGEEMVVDPKPPMGVPRISFSSYIKERASVSVDVFDEQGDMDEEDEQ